MRRFFHVVLILAIGSVHAFGAYATVEVRHSHDMADAHHHSHVPTQQKEQEHHHDHDHHGHDHHHDHHDHAPADEPAAPCDSQGSESDCPTHEHTHTETLSGDAPLMIAIFSKAGSLILANASEPILGRDACPEGPYYALIKPPQLG